MEDFKPQNFNSSKADDFLKKAIEDEKKRRAEKKDDSDDGDDNEQEEPQLGGDIELVPAQDDDQGQENVAAVEFEPGGSISEDDAEEFERDVKYKKAGGDPDRFPVDGDVDGMISDGESMKAELLKKKKELEGSGEIDGRDYQDYKNINERLNFIKHKLKDLNDTKQGEAMESFIERQEETNKQQNVPSEELDEQGEAMKAYLKREGVWEENQESQGRRVDVVDEAQEVESNTETDAAPEQEVVPDTTENENEGQQEELSVEQLHENAEQSHQALIEAQRRFSRAKGEFGLVGKIRQKLGIAGADKKEELNQSKEEFDQAKKGLKDAEEKFRDEYRKYTKQLVDQKKIEMIAQHQSRREANNWSEEETVQEMEKYKKLPEFKEALRSFVVSEKVVDSKHQEIEADGEMRETVEKLSLLEDMNNKIMAVNKAKIEALSESDKSILQKTWDWYRKQPKSKKIWYGVACAAPLAAGAALAGGATVGAALGAAAFGGVTKGASSFVSMGVGGFVYKKSRKWHQTRQGSVEAKKEKKMVKEISKDKDIDVYAFMKDRLAQEKKDNYKSLAAAGVAGFAVGGGMRGIWSQEGLAGLEGPPDDAADADIEISDDDQGVPLKEGAADSLAEAQINQGIRDTFNANAAKLGGVDQFENKFQTWKQMRQELIEKGQEDTKAFQELDKTFGKEAYANYQKLHHEVDPKGDVAVGIENDIINDWDQIIDKTGDIPPEFSDLAAFDSFRDFVEEKYGNFDPSKKVIVEQWREYKGLVPADAQKDRAFQFFDKRFDRYENAPNTRWARREFNSISKLLNDSNNEYEMRIHGAEYADKMGIKFDPFGKGVKGTFEGHVLTEINGHKIPLDLLSEEDKIKVLGAREMAQQMSGGMDEKSIQPDDNINEFELNGRNEDPKSSELESEAANEVVAQKLSASEFKEGIENMRNGGRMPNLQQMRDYKHAISAEKAGVEFFPKSQLPDDIVEKLVSVRELEASAESNLGEHELEEDEYMVQQEITEDQIASDGAGQEFGAGYDPELRDLEADDKTDLKTESIPDLDKFNFDLAKDDILWAKLSDNMGGNELKVAETLNEFRKETAKGLVNEYGYSPKDAQNYVKWRFQNLQQGDTISFGDEKLSIANFVDKGNTDFFASKFNIRTTMDEEAIAALDEESKMENAA